MTSGGGARLRVKQVRSGIGYNKKQNATLRAMGLGRMGRERDLPDNEQVRGMITSIRHLVTIVSDTEETAG